MMTVRARESGRVLVEARSSRFSSSTVVEVSLEQKKLKVPMRDSKRRLNGSVERKIKKRTRAETRTRTTRTRERGVALLG